MNRGLRTRMALLVAAAALVACSGQTPGPVSATLTLAYTPPRQPDLTAPPAATGTMRFISPTPTRTPTGTATASITPTIIPTAAATATAIPPCFVSYAAPIAFMPDGARIVVQAEAGVQIFNLQTMREEAFLEAPARLVWAATALSPDGTTLAWALDDYTIQLLRIADGQVLHTLRGHTDVVGKLRFGPSGDRLFSASHVSWVRIWAMDGEQVGAFQPTNTLGWPNQVLGLAVSPDGSMIATIPFDGPAKLWDAGDYHLVSEQGASGGYDYSDIAFSPNGELIVADTANGLLLWRTADGAQLLGGNPGINSMAAAFSPDGRLLAYADLNDMVLSSPDGTLQLRTLVGHSSPVWQLVFSPDSALLMSADGIGLRLWRVDSGELLYVGERTCP
jgi:WD40 repeat protein